MTDGAGDDPDDREVVVVGGGPAGTAAAIGLLRQGRTVTVVDDGTERIDLDAPVHGFPSRDGRPFRELVVTARREVAALGGAVVHASAVRARRGENGFLLGVTLPEVFQRAVSGTDPGGLPGIVTGDVRACRAIVVATGLIDHLPDVAGLPARWGRDVLPCPSYLGLELRRGTVGVLATGPDWREQVHRVRRTARAVVLFTHTGTPPTPHQQRELGACDVEVVLGEVAALMAADDRLIGALLATGDLVSIDALVVAPDAFARAPVPISLDRGPAVETVDDVIVGSVVPAGPGGRTTVPGLWVTGSIADRHATILDATASGAATAVAVAADLVEEDVRSAVAGRRGLP